MPASGDQHSSIANPFEAPQPRINEYTAQEIATLQSRLEKQLGPEYISSRAGPSGAKVHYIAAEKCIALANEVFGFNGWSSAIQNVQVDFVDEHPQTQRIALGLSVIVRVTLRDGTYHEDIGYGQIENCRSKAQAFEKAKKEGTTDALKRALRNFGNVLGNCIYDKGYLAKVTKLKVAPTRFDEKGLHRHADYIKKEEADVSLGQLSESYEDLLGDMDEVDFSVVEGDHPDEVMLDTSGSSTSTERSHNQGTNTNAQMQPPSRPLGRSVSHGNPQRQPQTPNGQALRPGVQTQSILPHQQTNNAARTGVGPPGITTTTTPINGAASNGSHAPAATGLQNAEGAGFFSARAVNQLPEESLSSASSLVNPTGGLAFNPRAESPSIRKTPGIDHSTSKPLARNGQHVLATATTAAGPATTAANGAGAGSVAPGPTGGSGAAGVRGNVVNPQLDQTRRIGAPPGAGSPLANRGQYRPPTMKRPLPGEAGGAGGAGAGSSRAPLVDVSNSHGMVVAAGADVKRQKMS